MHRTDNQPQGQRWAKKTCTVRFGSGLLSAGISLSAPEIGFVGCLVSCKHWSMICRWGLSPGSFLHQNSNISHSASMNHDPSLRSGGARTRDDFGNNSMCDELQQTAPPHSGPCVSPSQGNRNPIPLCFGRMTILVREAPAPPSDVYCLSLRVVLSALVTITNELKPDKGT